MSVLELAAISITSPHTLDTPELKYGLQNALQVLNKASGFTFDLLQQIEDASVIYIVGSWTSVEAHNKFLPSPENQALLENLKDYISVNWMFHVEIEKSALDLSVSCIGITRHFVKAGNKEDFSKVWNENHHHLAEYTKPYPLVGGWRIDGVEEGLGGEWVQFAGFQSVEHHHEFVKTEGFEEYGKIRQFLEGFEVKHARFLAL